MRFGLSGRLGGDEPAQLRTSGCRLLGDDRTRGHRTTGSSGTTTTTTTGRRPTGPDASATRAAASRGGHGC